MKKILYIHHDDGQSGASRSLSFLVEQIDPKKYKAKINCIFNGVVLDLFKDKPVTIIKKRGIYPFHGSTVTGMYFKLFFMNFLKIPSTLVTAYRMIKIEKPDLIHLNSSSLFVVGAIAKLINKKIKVICHVREPLLKNSISGAIIKSMNYHFIDHFIAIDHYTGHSMKTRNNMDVIYNSVNFEDYNPDLPSGFIREELGLKDTDIIFLYLARVAKCNGAIDFINVANTLSEQYSNYHFVLTGIKEGSVDYYTRKVIKMAKNIPNVHLMPFREEVPLIIAGSDILVVPFTQPHFARAIIEAASVGRPSIGTDVGGVNELIVNDRTGFLYKSEEELVKYCRKLAENSELRKTMGNEAVLFAKENFDNDINTKTVFRIYEKLLNA